MDQSRREFVRIATIAALGVCSGCGVHGEGGASEADGEDDQDTGDGVPDDLEIMQIAIPAGWTAVMLANNPKLNQVGGFVYKNLRVGKVIIARIDNAPTFVAMSAICTHQGCSVKYQTAGQKMHCPCHGSDFSTTGTVIRGPANRPLVTYEVRWSAAQNGMIIHAT